jgi:GDP-L-fucose synthase
MVGSAVVRRLQHEPGVEVLAQPRAELDLRDQAAVTAYFERVRPAAVIFAAAKVGGIHANNMYPVEFLTDNLRAQLATMTSAFETGVRRFLFLGSTCIYPRLAPQPISEDQLLTSPLEKTNEAYALAKITGLKLCEYYRREYGVLFHSAMPTNLYGPGDNYHPEHSHVLPAMLRRFHEARLADQAAVTIWGTGTPRREFLYVDDLADALVHLLSLDNPPDWVNVGSGTDLSILELAQLVAKTVGYTGRIELDLSKPDGTPRKLTDISLLKSTGWQPSISLEEGLARTYAAFQHETASQIRREK